MLTTRQDRDAFRAQLRSAMSALSPESEVRRLITDPLGYDPAAWARLCEQALPALLVPEEAGGQGLTVVEGAVAFEECGRVLLSAPLLAGALTVLVLTRCPSGPSVTRLLGEIANGSERPTLALDDGDVPVTARPAGSGWKLSGVKTRVLDAQASSVFVVSAAVPAQAGPTGGTAGGTALFALPTADPGVTCRPMTALDLTRRQARLDLSTASATLLAEDSAAALAAAGPDVALLACAEMLGAADHCLELAVDYAKTREQFGHPIGGFQAIKHLLADSLVLVEQIRAAVETAAEAAADPTQSDEIAVLVPVVKAYCSESAPRVAESLIQVLGGIGFTWEHAAHLYLRRIKALAGMFGSAREQRAILEQELGLVTR
jgi:alkylation response protein AidB-like acyl-CoA dehydrogenase